MRSSHAFANGQLLQVKTASVPFLPATLASEIALPSTAFFILVSAIGAFVPSGMALPPWAKAADAEARIVIAARAVPRVLMVSSVSVAGVGCRAWHPAGARAAGR